MKKGITAILLLLLVMLLAGCEQEQPETAGMQIYYIDETGTRLVTENYIPEAQSGDALIQELIGKMSKPSAVEGHKKAIPDGIGITSAVCSKKNLKLDFNGTYVEMDHITEVFCRAAVVKTLVQVPDIETVEFTINGQELADIKGNPLGVMNADTFIDTKGEGINSYQFGALSLYFADESGKMLVKEMRNVHYSSNTSLERVIVEEIIKGPVNEKLFPVVPQNVKILEIKTEENTCTINLDQGFQTDPDSITALPETTIYSIVDSICANTKITSVQIQINGKSDEKFREAVDLKQPFTMDESLIKKEDVEQTDKMKPTVGVDPSLQ